MSNSLQPHGLQHARLPCPSLSPRFMSIELVMLSNHFILCHSLLPLPLIFPESRSFPINQFFASGGQSIGASASETVLPANIQSWFSLTGFISLQSKGLSSLLQHHSSKASILQCSAFFMVQLSLSYMTTGSLYKLQSYGEMACITQWSYDPWLQSHSKWMGDREEFWQNMVPWRRK